MFSFSPFFTQSDCIIFKDIKKSSLITYFFCFLFFFSNKKERKFSTNFLSLFINNNCKVFFFNKKEIITFFFHIFSNTFLFLFYILLKSNINPINLLSFINYPRQDFVSCCFYFSFIFIFIFHKGKSSLLKIRKKPRKGELGGLKRINNRLELKGGWMKASKQQHFFSN